MLCNRSCTTATKRLSAVSALLLLASNIGASQAAILPINSLLDPGDGVCNAGDPSDPGDCTLREALAAASPGDEIVFDTSLSGETITLSELLFIDSAITIKGPSAGESPITLNANGLRRGITVSSGADASISGIKITGATDSGIRNDGSLVLERVTLSQNGNDEFGVGGGIVNVSGAALTLSDGSITNNTARIGGGLANVSGSVVVTNTTISGNQASGSGGGTYNSSSQGPASMNLTNATLSGNSADVAGGGMWSEGGTTEVFNGTVTGNSTSGNGGGIAVTNVGTELTITDTIVVENTREISGTAVTDNCFGPASGIPAVVSGGYNLFTADCPANGADDIVVDDTTVVLLAELADNGGPNKTHALVSDSPAIDAGNPEVCASIPTDQRGAPRSAGTNCDIGAFESGPPAMGVDPETLDFGTVDVGTSVMLIVNLYNEGNDTLTVSSLSLNNGDYTFAAPALPFSLGLGETVDIALTYSPTNSGQSAASLVIDSDDPQNGSLSVSLTGEGVAQETPPGEQLQAILSFLDESLVNGTLIGTGRGNAQIKRPKALRNMIEAAGDRLENNVANACRKLHRAYYRTDGLRKPRDFVQGDSAPLLADMIAALRENLGCGN